MSTLVSIFVAYGVVWLLHAGYLVSIAARQNSLRQEITTLKAMIEQGSQVSGGR